MKAYHGQVRVHALHKHHQTHTHPRTTPPSPHSHSEAAVQTAFILDVLTKTRRLLAAHARQLQHVTDLAEVHSAKRDIVACVHGVVGMLSHHAGKCLREESSRTRVRNIILGIPDRWVAAMTGEHEGETESTPVDVPALGYSSDEESEDEDARDDGGEAAAREHRGRVRRLAVESGLVLDDLLQAVRAAAA